MTAQPENQSLAAWILERVAEDEAAAVAEQEYRNAEMIARRSAFGEAYMIVGNAFDPARVLAQCAAIRQIIAFHESWPVLVEGPPTFEQGDGDDINSMTMRMTRQMAWLTTQEYRAKFGDEPPTSATLTALAGIWGYEGAEVGV